VIQDLTSWLLGEAALAVEKNFEKRPARNSRIQDRPEFKTVQFRESVFQLEVNFNKLCGDIAGGF